MDQWWYGRPEIEGSLVRTSLEATCCVLEQGTFALLNTGSTQRMSLDD